MSKKLVTVWAMFANTMLFLGGGCGPQLALDSTRDDDVEMQMGALDKEALKAAKLRATLAAQLQPGRFKVSATATSVKALDWAALAQAAPNGLRYRIGRNEAPLSPSYTNPPVQSVSQNEVVCRTVSQGISRLLPGPFNAGGALPPSLMFPGAVFRDVDVAKGSFTRKTPPRLPGSLIISTPNNISGGVSVDVSNLNNSTEVANKVDQLLDEAGGAPARTDFTSEAYEVKARESFALDYQISMEANLFGLLGIPATGEFAEQVGANFSSEQNFAVGVIEQVFYTISVGGEGPASTFQQPVDGNMIMVTDVLYGRRALVTVASTVSEAEAKLALNSLINAEGVAKAEVNLNAQAKAALASSAVRVRIVGGDLNAAVLVHDLASLRQYVEQVSPATVVGVNAAPLAYTFYYAADNAAARVVASADFQAKECFRPERVKVSLLSLTPTRVVDAWWDEELYGTIRVNGVGPALEGTRDLFSRGSNNWVRIDENQRMAFSDFGIFSLNPALAETQVAVGISLRDRVIADGEDLGAGGAESFGYEALTQYVTVEELADQPSHVVSRLPTVNQGDAIVQVGLRFELLPGAF